MPKKALVADGAGQPSKSGSSYGTQFLQNQAVGRSVRRAKRVRRPCVPDDFEEELTQEECDMLDRFFPQYEDVEMGEEEAAEPKGGCPTCEDEADVTEGKTARTKCICGSMIMPKGMKSHEKSKKHLAFVSKTHEESPRSRAVLTEPHEEIIKIDSILI